MCVGVCVGWCRYGTHHWKTQYQIIIRIILGREWFAKELQFCCRLRVISVDGIEPKTEKWRSASVDELLFFADASYEEEGGNEKKHTHKKTRREMRGKRKKVEKDRNPQFLRGRDTLQPASRGWGTKSDISWRWLISLKSIVLWMNGWRWWRCCCGSTEMQRDVGVKKNKRHALDNEKRERAKGTRKEQ